MKTISTFLATISFILCLEVISAEKNEGKPQKHLFILSGQSNMAALNPKVAFIPAVEKEYGKENVLVVKSAKSGRPIRMWSKDFRYPKGHRKFEQYKNPNEKKREKFGELYDVLINAVNEAKGDKEYDTVTFCWMQGEADAMGMLAASYEAAFKGILSQLKNDLKKDKIYFVIARINDADMNDEMFKHWTKIRDVQVKLAEEDDHGQWIDCDDLNIEFKEGLNIKKYVHNTRVGYKKMGERFAEKAIALINGTVEK